MKSDITQALMAEHRLILRMLDLLERKAARTAEGGPTDWQFYLDGVDFIRNYADRFHHAKEEDVLFEALVHNGMPREHSPVAAMLLEHEQGRAHVRALETAAREALAGLPGREAAIVEHARAYAALLREHIAKEDGILYPLAERLIPDTLRDGILAGYREAEARMTADLAARFEAMVLKYEQEQ
ncbi:MAG TPA: hemerythrin domain-containing protein [Desulfuromonadaceae bacterium]